MPTGSHFSPREFLKGSRGRGLSKSTYQSVHHFKKNQNCTLQKLISHNMDRIQTTYSAVTYCLCHARSVRTKHSTETLARVAGQGNPVFNQYSVCLDGQVAARLSDDSNCRIPRTEALCRPSEYEVPWTDS